MMISSTVDQELAAMGKSLNPKAGRKTTKKDRENLQKVSASRGLDKKGKPGSPKVKTKMRDRTSKPQRVENLVKEEGEMSDNEEVYEHFKEVKWMEWCEDVMADEIVTLERLQRLQTTSAKLPKEKVRCYLVLNSGLFRLMEQLHKFLFSFVIRCFQKFAITCSFLEEE